jgi:dihydrofolate synthase/folylpolyglutamate synthase
VVDGAHNDDAAERLAVFIKKQIPRPRLLVFAVMKDKDVRAVVSSLAPLFDRVMLTQADSMRGADPSELASLFEGAGVEVLTAIRPADALRRALAAPEKNVVVAGSLYLAGAALAYLDRAMRKTSAASARTLTSRAK